MYLEVLIMSVITARIPDNLNEALSKVAKIMERPKTFLIKEAIKEYLILLEEDAEAAEIHRELQEQDAENGIYRRRKFRTKLHYDYR